MLVASKTIAKGEEVKITKKKWPFHFQHYIQPTPNTVIIIILYTVAGATLGLAVVPTPRVQSEEYSRS